MAGKVQIKIDVDSESVEFATDKTLTLTEKTRLLKKELQTVPEGTKEWHILNNTFNDTKDALDRVNTKSKDIFGTFSLLPGPIGQISNSLETTIDAFKIFGGMKTSDIKNQVSNLATDFKDMAKTIGNLTGITKVYTLLNNGLAKAFGTVATAETGAAVAARGLAAAITATGVGVLVVAIGALIGKIIEWTSSTEEADAANESLNKTLEEQQRILAQDLKNVDTFTKRNVLLAKIAGKSEEEIYKIQKEGGEEKLKLLRDNDNNLFNEQQKFTRKQGDYAKLTDEQRATKAEEFNTKLRDSNQAIIDQILANDNAGLTESLRIEDKKREKKKAAGDKLSEQEKAQRKKDLEDLKKGNQESYDETLSAKDKEINDVNRKYTTLISLANKYGQDTTKLKQGQAAALAKITDKYNKEDEEKEKKLQEERLKKLEEYLDKEQKLRESKRNYQSQKAQQDLAKQLFSGLIKEQEYQDKSLASNLAFAEKKQADDENTYNINKLALDTLYANKGISQKQYEEQSASDKAIYDQQALDNDVAVTDASLAISQKAYEDKKTIAERTTEALRAQLQAQMEMQLAYVDAIGAVGNILKMFAGKNKNLQKAAIILSQGAAIGKILVEASASVAGQTAAGLRNGILLGGPILNPIGFAANTAATVSGIVATKVSAAIGIAGAIAGAIKGISDINAADDGGDSGGGGSAAAAPGSKFADGGLLGGRPHSQGGIKTPYGELEGGEYVINKRSTQSFLPILNAINSSGNRNNSQNGNVASMDAIQSMMMNQSSPIVKTYVVASDIYSQAQADKKIADLARL